MTAPAAAHRDVHGVRVAVEGAIHPDPTLPLLGRFPRSPGAGAPDLTIRLRPARARGEGAAGRLVMDLGPVRAHAADGALRFTDGATVLAVSAAGDEISGSLHPDSLAQPRVLEDVLLLLALAAALRPHGLFHLHAAALASPAGAGVLVAGQSGAGKSTLAVALASHGFAWLSDDVSFLAARAGGPTVLACPRPFHLGRAAAGAFPALAAHLAPYHSWREKLRLDPRAAFPGRERAAARPELVLLPEVSGAARTAVQDAAPVEALGALVESSALLFVDGMAAVPEHLALLGALLDGARCLRVRLGADLLRDGPGTAARIAATLADGAPGSLRAEGG